MSLFQFPSIAHPQKYGYAFDTSAWSSSSETSGYFRQFETYGDGLVRHSCDWTVTFDYLTDYLASMAEAMLASPELIGAVGSMFRSPVDEETMAFAASVVFRESDKDWTKRRYYSKSLRKIGNRTKEHDKRYQEITHYQDGSCASMLRVILSDYSSGLERYLTVEAVRLWAVAQKNGPSYGEGWPEYFAGEWGKNNDLRNGVYCCRSIAEASRLRQSAEGVLGNYRERLAASANVSALAS